MAIFKSKQQKLLEKEMKDNPQIFCDCDNLNLKTFQIDFEDPQKEISKLEKKVLGKRLERNSTSKNERER